MFRAGNTLPGLSGWPVSDRIFIEGIKFHGYHGLTRMEREVGVRLSVDVSIE